MVKDLARGCVITTSLTNKLSLVSSTKFQARLFVVKGFGTENVLKLGQKFSFFVHVDKVTVFIDEILRTTTKLGKELEKAPKKIKPHTFAEVVFRAQRPVFVDTFRYNF